MRIRYRRDIVNIETRLHQGADLCIYVGDFLDSAALASTAVLSGYDAAVRPLAEFLDHLILCIDNKGRIQGGERVP